MGMKKLYRVDVEYSVYVMAESEDCARQLAMDMDVTNDLDCSAACNADAQEVDSAMQIPRQWIISIPYGADDDKTIMEILAEAAQA